MSDAIINNQQYSDIVICRKIVELKFTEGNVTLGNIDQPTFKETFV